MNGSDESPSSRPLSASIEADFDRAERFIRERRPPIVLDNESRLTFYALFKQATVGICKEGGFSKFNLVQTAKR